MQLLGSILFTLLLFVTTVVFGVLVLAFYFDYFVA